MRDSEDLASCTLEGYLLTYFIGVMGNGYDFCQSYNTYP